MLKLLDLQNDARSQAAPSSEPIAEMRGITKSYGARRVLDNVGLQLRPAERVALIGPSGSGKTTILRLLIGLDRPDAGDIEIAGRPLWPKGGKRKPGDERQAREVRQCVGMVFQQFNLFPHMTALENVREPIRHVLGEPIRVANERAEELLTQVGLRKHLDQRPAQLSGGQQQRVAIARAIGLRPRIMLFDEITSALDPEVVGEVLQVVRKLTDDHDMAIMMVTHEISFAAAFADRILMFDSGSIVEDGPPQQVLKEPAHQRTRQFLRAIIDREGR
ncbi:ectoine/hydroxyectoine ABC transporter ATP-binding protein EhuA [Pigmentiphaga soli]|uniref:Ectoine/hydroxyectoine ABC transporter ATP-binding protein EhuA n=1 Tax=Pigmentiphaga soli TaxID=1007095 RepID=A0ABP8GWE5_9BURK